MPIQSCRPKSDSAPLEPFEHNLGPKELNQKAISARVGAYFSPWFHISPNIWTVFAVI